jgi:exodeoxyribonuclease VII large subunit
LPRFPRRIAFVTSPTGAAVRDFLEVLRRRWRGVQVLVIPAKVQGEGAADEIVRGIQAANRLQPKIDVLVVGRGGGSLEDLWCFNEEPVVRAIFGSRIPVVSAVGHEIDVTLSDLVADVRALTPSEAAERVVPSAEELRAALHVSRKRISAALRARAADARSRLESLQRHGAFRRPFDTLRERARTLDELDVRGLRALRQLAERQQDRLQGLAAQLDSLSPLGVLARGYSLTSRLEEDRLLTDASQVAPGDQIRTRLAQGTLISRVEETTGDGSLGQ